MPRTRSAPPPRPPNGFPGDGDGDTWSTVATSARNAAGSRSPLSIPWATRRRRRQGRWRLAGTPACAIIDAAAADRRDSTTCSTAATPAGDAPWPPITPTLPARQRRRQGRDGCNSCNALRPALPLMISGCPADVDQAASPTAATTARATSANRAGFCGCGPRLRHDFARRRCLDAARSTRTRPFRQCGAVSATLDATRTA